MYLKIFKFMVLILFLFNFVGIAEEKKEVEFIIDSWLKVGPVETFIPVLGDDAQVKYGLKELLSYEQFNVINYNPESGKKIIFPLPSSFETKWEEVNNQIVNLGNFNDEKYLTAYTVTYIKSSEFTKATLKINTNSSFKVFLDGVSIKDQINQKPLENKNNKDVSTEIVLEPGFHTLLFKLLAEPDKDKEKKWIFSASINFKDENKLGIIGVSTSPEHFITIHELLELPTINGASLSSDGKLVLISLSKTIPPEGEAEKWIEVRKSSNGELVKSFRGLGNFSSPQWAPDYQKFAFISSIKDTSSIWIADLTDGTSKPVVRNLNKFESYEWLKDGKNIIFSLTTEPEKNKSGLKRLESLHDRRSYGRNRSILYVVSVEEGTSYQLTAGDESIYYQDSHPDGKTFLILRELEDYAERPYIKKELYKFDLSNIKLELLLQDKWMKSGQWSPDGKKMLIIGGPSCFNGLGKIVSEGKIPNDYDSQAYIFDQVTKEAIHISKNFKPAINYGIWAKKDWNIYFLVTEGQKDALYQYIFKKGIFKKIDIPLDDISKFDISNDSYTGICFGTTTNYPTKLYKFDLRTDKSELIFNPTEKCMKKVKVGNVEEWNFTNNEGYKIQGRIHYPPDFDPAKKYPAIVYYYGGTTPVTMNFGGRYPNNWWAALGYVVYVLQPRGAIGYGQEFSAFHVNDWGKYALYDIIEGTEKFIAEHPFVDSKRVGCLGASYGGFTTELIVARTNIYAAAISHAGISSLASYWGAGYWGYEYSGGATADKFPWNAPEIYVDRSPLYNADKIKTPLLLLHGSADTNVPTSESDYLFTALKLLGREVEYIQILDENHWIIDYKKRIQWYKTIIAWFEQWLKGKPDYWEYLYPLKRMADQPMK